MTLQETTCSLHVLSIFLMRDPRTVVVHPWAAPPDDASLVARSILFACQLWDPSAPQRQGVGAWPP